MTAENTDKQEDDEPQGGMLIPSEFTEQILQALRETQPIRFGRPRPLGLSFRAFPSADGPGLQVTDCSIVYVPLKTGFKVRRRWWGRRVYDRLQWWLMLRRFRRIFQRRIERLNRDWDAALAEKMEQET